MENKFTENNTENQELLPQETIVVKEEVISEEENLENLLRAMRNIIPYSAEENGELAPIKADNRQFVYNFYRNVHTDYKKRTYIEGFDPHTVWVASQIISSSLNNINEIVLWLSDNRTSKSQEKTLQTIAKESKAKITSTQYWFKKLVDYSHRDIRQILKLQNSFSVEDEINSKIIEMAKERNWYFLPNFIFDRNQNSKKTRKKHPERIKTVECDNLLITPKGIFDIEIKSYLSDNLTILFDGTVNLPKIKMNIKNQYDFHKKTLDDIYSSSLLTDIIDPVKVLFIFQGNKENFDNKSSIPIITFKELEEYIDSFDEIMDEDEMLEFIEHIKEFAVYSTKEYNFTHHGINQEYLNRSFFPKMERLLQFIEVSDNILGKESQNLSFTNNNDESKDDGNISEGEDPETDSE